MHRHVYWVLEVDVNEGSSDAFTDLMHEMVKATRANEPGTLNYEWSFSDDGSRCHIYERYEDAGAVMTHLSAFGEHYAERFMACVTPTRFTVYGQPDDAVRAALTPFGAAFMTPADGFVR